MTVREFQLWRRSAKKGDKLVYHKGFLARARGEGKFLASTLEAKMRELGDFVYAAYDKGNVTLVQKRLGPGQFDYIAIAT